MRGDTANENKQFKETIEKGNEEVKLTSDVHNRPPYCVHHGIFTYLTLYCTLVYRVIVLLGGGKMQIIENCQKFAVNILEFSL